MPWYVKLDKKVNFWLAAGEGHSLVTLIAGEARQFADQGEADTALTEARKHRPWPEAEVVEIAPPKDAGTRVTWKTLVTAAEDHAGFFQRLADLLDMSFYDLKDRVSAGWTYEEMLLQLVARDPEGWRKINLANPPQNGIEVELATPESNPDGGYFAEIESCFVGTDEDGSWKLPRQSLTATHWRPRARGPRDWFEGENLLF